MHRLSSSFFTRAVFVAFLAGGSPFGPPAEAQSTGHVRVAAERVVRSPSTLGVPLHPSATSNAVAGRIPNGTTVRVLGWTANRRRVEIEGEAGRGFIVVRYLEPAVRRPVRPESEIDPRSPFSSHEACERSAELARGDSSQPPEIKLASWNVRWFPDGEADGTRGTGTDVAWLACVIARLGADVLAVQEFVRHEDGRAALEALLERLRRSTGARWRAVFDGCPADGRQHVGFLFREDRVRLENPRDVARLNPGRSGCDHRLRPGLLVRAVGRSGQVVDLLNVHLDSGVTARDHGHRRLAARVLSDLVASRVRDGGPPLVVLGDFNTMGCASCAPPATAAGEIAWLVATLDANGLVHATPDAACTERAGGRSGLLDHVFLDRRLAEAPGARVLGPCRDACTGPGRRAEFFERISDHCPIVVGLDGAPSDVR